MDDASLKKQVEELLAEVRILRAEIKTKAAEDQLRTAILLSEIVANQVVMMNGYQSSELTFLIPGYQGRKFSFTLYRTDDGRLCFKRPRDDYKWHHRVFAATTQKSGSHILHKIIDFLGYDYVGVHFLNERLYDRRTVNDGTYEGYFPYNVQVQLVLPGQYMAGHVSFSRVKYAHKPKEILFTTRDLRECVVSLARHKKSETQDIFPWKEVTEEELLTLFDTPTFSSFLGVTIDTPKLIDYCHVVRFEELTSSDPKIQLPSAQSIATVTRCPLDEVMEAIHNAYGVRTETYTGKHSRIADVWTRKIEERFQFFELDKANEELGYSRSNF